MIKNAEMNNLKFVLPFEVTPNLCNGTGPRYAPCSNRRRCRDDLRDSMGSWDHWDPHLDLVQRYSPPRMLKDYNPPSLRFFRVRLT